MQVPEPRQGIQRRHATVEVTASGTTATVKTKCNPICARVYEPVCGSNSVTYANQCLLDYAACKNPCVTKLSNGKCVAKKKGKGCVPAACTFEEDPVCASNGVSYLNTCMFENAQCQFPELSILHEVHRVPRRCRPETAYCADVCAAERCGEHEECRLLDAECFTAPCSPIATCIPIESVE
ncbi:Kazal-type serine protease inhibitor, partial [Globisporangium splendens]